MELPLAFLFEDWTNCCPQSTKSSVRYIENNAVSLPAAGTSVCHRMVRSDPRINNDESRLLVGANGDCLE